MRLPNSSQHRELETARVELAAVTLERNKLQLSYKLLEKELDTIKLAVCGAGQQLTSKFPLAGELRTQWGQWTDDMREFLIIFSGNEGVAGIAAFKATLKACAEHAQGAVSVRVSELAGLLGVQSVKAQELLRDHFPGSFPLAVLGDALESKLACFPNLPPNCAKSLARLLAAFALSDPAVMLVFGTADARPYAKDLGTFIDNPPPREAALSQAHEIVPAVHIGEKVLVSALFAAIPVDHGSQASAASATGGQRIALWRVADEPKFCKFS